jgi:glycosyltransferase involved in cell wall biosynthesis
MKVAFDNQIFSIQQYGGISRSFVKLIQQLNNLGVEAKIFSPINYNRYLQEIPNNLKFGKYLEEYPLKTYRLINIISKYFSNYLIKKWKADIIHETYYSSINFNSNKTIKVLTVYDMTHEVFLGKFFDKKDPNIKKKINSIKRADHIISISENTKKDLINFFPETKNKITVIRLGFDLFKKNYNYDNLKIQKKNPYILYVGDRNHIKNFKSFIKAFSNSNFLKANFDIVIFGNKKITNEENRLFQELNIENNIIYISGNDNILSNCYSQADLFIFPSLYEGFGLPLLESMGHKCPVVCSNNSSLPEVAGNAAIYFNPYDINSIQFSIEKILKDKKLQFDMIKKGLNQCKKFTWKKNAEETLSLYNRLLK